MRNMLMKSALLAIICLASAAVPASAADMYMAVKAREGLTLYFSAIDNNSAYYHSSGNGISHRTAQGWYIQKLPADIDLKRMDEWCVTVLEPRELFEKYKCSRRTDLPEDGIFKLTFDL